MNQRELIRLSHRLDVVERRLQPRRSDTPGLLDVYLSRAAAATANAFTWATRFTKTSNDHWKEEGRETPYEHFPLYEYIRHIFEILECESEHLLWVEKSRDLMLSWSIVAYLTLQAMKVPHRGILFQTQKEDKVIQLVEYAKCLYKTQPEWLRECFPLEKPLPQQADTELRFLNGSCILGIPGGADQIRSFHPWGYFNDESSFQPEAGECFNEALAVVKGKIIFCSTAGPGWYADVRRDIIRTEDN